MKKPMIAVSPRSNGQSDSARKYCDNESYFAYVTSNGGIPMMTGIVSEEIADQIATQMDGLMLTGGEDVDPTRYGEDNTFSYLIDKDLEETDILLYRAFVRYEKPVLGICRGIQIINVSDGGTLIQDIHHYDRKALEHGQNHQVPPVPNYLPVHSVSIVKDSRLYGIFGASADVNSFHHQALLKPADGFKVAAISEDGFIEAIEKDHVTAVQWHPERMIHDLKQQNLMKQFLEECSLSAAGLPEYQSHNRV